MSDLVPTINLTARQINPRICHLADERIADLNQRSLFGLCFHHLFFSRLVLPAGSSAARKAAFAQTAVNCAILACALERYRRQYGELPELLSTLQPQFIQQVPHDLINGEPLRYHRTGPGEYVLYSVGWNERDDGGVVGTAKEGDPHSLSQGDWVWRLP